MIIYKDDITEAYVGFPFYYSWDMPFEIEMALDFYIGRHDMVDIYFPFSYRNRVERTQEEMLKSTYYNVLDRITLGESFGKTFQVQGPGIQKGTTNVSEFVNLLIDNPDAMGWGDLNEYPNIVDELIEREFNINSYVGSSDFEDIMEKSMELVKKTSVDPNDWDNIDKTPYNASEENPIRVFTDETGTIVHQTSDGRIWSNKWIPGEDPTTNMSVVTDNEFLYYQGKKVGKIFPNGVFSSGHKLGVWWFLAIKESLKDIKWPITDKEKYISSSDVEYEEMEKEEFQYLIKDLAKNKDINPYTIIFREDVEKYNILTLDTLINFMDSYKSGVYGQHQTEANDCDDVARRNRAHLYQMQIKFIGNDNGLSTGLLSIPGHALGCAVIKDTTGNYDLVRVEGGGVDANWNNWESTEYIII